MLRVENSGKRSGPVACLCCVTLLEDLAASAKPQFAAGVSPLR